MRKVLVIALLLLFCGAYAVAQDHSKGEFFAGYSYLHVDCGSGCNDSSFPAGFNLDGTYYFANLLGLTADFDYHHRGLSAGIGGGTAHTVGIHGGPRVKARMGKFEPFAHFLVGLTHGSISNNAAVGNVSDNSFSMKLGGGLDVAGSRHVALRLGEFNYYYTKFGANSQFSPNGMDHQNNWMISAGIVLR